MSVSLSSHVRAMAGSHRRRRATKRRRRASRRSQGASRHRRRASHRRRRAGSEGHEHGGEPCWPPCKRSLAAMPGAASALTGLRAAGPYPRPAAPRTRQAVRRLDTMRLQRFLRSGLMRVATGILLLSLAALGTAAAADSPQAAAAKSSPQGDTWASIAKLPDWSGVWDFDYSAGAPGGGLVRPAPPHLTPAYAAKY